MSPKSSSLQPPASSRSPFDFDLVIFDLDGTLVDAFGMIARCFNRVMRDFGLPEMTLSEVRRIVGTGSKDLLRPYVPAERLEDALEIFYGEYEQRFLDETLPMPGAMELLKELKEKGIRMAVASNKNGIHCRRGLERLGMLPFMVACVGAGDVTNLKPKPDMIHRILEEQKVSKDRALLVGDSPIDVATSKAADIRCVCVTTGSHTREELEQAGADRAVSSLSELRTS